MRMRFQSLVLIAAASLIAAFPGFVSAQVVQVTSSSSTDAISATGGNGWGAGGKPKPTPTPAPLGKDPDWQGSGTTAAPGAWLTGTNWVGNAVPGTTDIANFANSTTGVGINMGGTTNNGANNQAVGAITLSTGGDNLTIGNTSTASNGTLTLNGATVGGVANTILSNTTAAGKTLTLANTVGSGNKTMTIALGNTANIINATAGNTIAISSVISQVNAGSSITFTGGGTLTLSGNNSFTGTLTVQNGTLSIATINNNAANGPLGNNSNAVVLGGSGTTGTLDYTGAGASSTKKFTMAIGGTGVFQVDTAGTTLTLNGVIDGSGNLTKAGAGTLALTAAETYTGATTINAGTLQITNNDVLPTGTALILANVAGVTFDLNAKNQTIGSLSGGGTTGGTVNLSGQTLTVGDSTDTTFAGVLGGSGSGKLTKVGTGTLTLSGTNTYTGATTVSAGVLKLASTNALPGGIGSTGGTGPLVLSGGVIGLASGDFTRPLGTATTNGAVNLTSGGGFAAYGADRIVNLGGASAGVTWNAGNFVANGNTFILGAANADHTVDFQNPISLGTSGTATRTIQVDNGSAAIDAKLSGLITGISSNTLQKTGTGTLALTANNTYLGATQIDAGTLYINGNQTSATGTTIVNTSGTTLGGTGTIGGAVSIASSGAILEAGTGSTGQTLTIKGALTQITTGSIIELALGPTLTHSTLALTSAGSSSFYSTQKFTFIDLGATTGTYQDIITGVTSNPGSLSGWTITNAGYVGSFSWDSLDNGIDLNLTAVPEPGTWCAAALALLAVGYIQRKRVARLLTRA
jgi:fibronectin-binding autotransporter adhesin